MPNVVFGLHPAASKRIIAQAVCRLPQVQEAFAHGKIIIGSGTTNVLVAEELLQTKFETFDPYVAGVITQRSVCVTDPSQRKGNWCIEKGQLVDEPWVDFLNSFQPGDIFIKGANAIDPFGNAAILLADSRGGTIGNAIGVIKARGVELIMPVGLEKLIPSCLAGESKMGQFRTSMRLGMNMGYMVVTGANIITEVESFKILFNAEAVPVAAGGVGGMEGAVVLAVDCPDDKTAEQVIALARTANRQSPIKVKRKRCSQCEDPCQMFKFGEEE